MSQWRGERTAGSSTVPASETTLATFPEVDLTVEIDETITPVVPSVSGFHPEDPPRPVGRIVTEDGTAMDIVVGEAIVVVPDLAAVEALRDHPEVEVVDFDHDPDADPEDGIDVLVRARDLASVDLAEAAWRIDTLEPGLTGTVLVDDPATAGTAIVMGRLFNGVSPEVSFNLVPIAHDVDEGQLLEGVESQLNAFDWPYVKSTAAQGIGLDTAWQMLDFHGKQQNRVTVVVVDKGFIEKPDFPENATIRKGDWGPANDWTCSNGSTCPYHGTQVSATIAGLHDNLQGTAGVAGPWVRLVTMPVQGGSYDTMKALREVIKDEKPDIVNMSFGSRTTVSVNGTRRQYDKTFRRAERWADTVAFASAGNAGENVDDGAPVYPCMIERVVCVGGMAVDATEKHDGSNYGSERSSSSVQIYGPYCVNVYADPAANDGAASQGCGTSFSSPFVAGVGALLRVADPGITHDEIKEILYDTAHVGGLGPLVSGYKRRIDAHMAVAEALGVVWTPPVVEISTPSGEFPVDEVISLEGSARSYVGEPIPLTWWSNLDGELNSVPSLTAIGANLSPGEHVIQATAVDRRGLASTAAITITIENEPPIVQILSPVNGQTLYEGSALQMIAYTHDPDIFVNEALADERVIWQVKQGSTVVWENDGHNVQTALNPGSYEIVLTGTDIHGVSRTDSVDIEVLELPPGQQPPSAHIIEPNTDISEGIGGGTKSYDLRGLAKDLNGNNVSGTRFKWTATADTGHSFDICVGSSVPGQGTGGGVVILKDCRETSVDLGLAPGAVGRTIWTITLSVVVDAQGTTVNAVRSIELTFAIG